MSSYHFTIKTQMSSIEMINDFSRVFHKNIKSYCLVNHFFYRTQKIVHLEIISDSIAVTPIWTILFIKGMKEKYVARLFLIVDKLTQSLCWLKVKKEKCCMTTFCALSRKLKIVISSPREKDLEIAFRRGSKHEVFNATRLKMIF